MKKGFWLQVAARNAADVLDIADELDDEGYTRPAIVIAPEHVPDSLRLLYARARANSDVVLDPAGFLLDRDPTQRARRHYPWLARGADDGATAAERRWPRPTDVDGWAEWMTASLDHQRTLTNPRALSVLVVPTPQLQAADGRDAFYRIMDAVEAARSTAPSGPPMWIGLNIDRDYLRTEEHLTRIANHVVTLDGTGIVLRCFQSELPPISDRRLLDGLRALVTAASASGVPVLLPQAGWLGWLAMGWGAHGFSGGLGNGTWYDRMPTPMSNVALRDKVFETQLLRHVPWSLHEDLQSVDGYLPCDCSACQAMSGRYSSAHAQKHQVFTASRLTDGAGRNVVGHVRRTLDDAIAFRDSLPLVLRERAEAGFLDTWRSFV